MPLPNASDKLIQQGHACNVVIYDESGTSSVVGLVTNASYNEDFQVTEALVIGFFGPVSLDAQNYKCTINLGVYVAYNPTAEITTAYLDGGTTTIQKNLKTRSEVALTGKGSVITQMDFVDLTGGTTYNSFNQCVIASNGANIQASTYVTANISLMCIERTI